MSSKIIIDTQTLTRTLARLAHEIIEHSEGYEEVYLVGIKRRGVPLAKMLKTNIESFSNLKVHLGELDITLYRDDLSEKYSSPQLNGTQIDFDVTNKKYHFGGRCAFHRSHSKSRNGCNNQARQTR